MNFINVINPSRIKKKSPRENSCLVVKYSNNSFIRLKKNSIFKLLNNQENTNAENETQVTKGIKTEDKNEISNENDINNSFINFLKEVNNEIKMVEWPSTERLFKQFVIVIISLVFSAIIIYSVDGVFASVSKFLFEGKN